MTAEPRHVWIASPEPGYGDVTAKIADPILVRRVGRRWWIATSLSFALVLVFIGAIFHLFDAGVGLFGINTTVVWGYAIANYVWWIAIASGGTLISSILVLTRQEWRSSINRFAEIMTVLAVAISGLFPILHLGRPGYAYWLVPYPNTMSVWPQWRSALVWDFWAITSYLVFSILFLYVSLLPDLATIRDRARSGLAQGLYGVLALGWRGSARHWQLHRMLHVTLAGLAIPLVVSVHSIVGLDFATSLMPGWQESIIPPYFVIGAVVSGLAMVLLLTALTRWGLALGQMITPDHFDAMAKIILAGSIALSCAYITEWFTAWYSGAEAERSLLAFVFAGDYARLLWTQLAFNCVLPQALWWRAVRRHVPTLVAISALILIGMWIQRILILWNTLSHEYAAAMWRTFHPTMWDWVFLSGSLGLFVFLYLLVLRLVPAVSMYEMRRLVHAEGAAWQDR